MGLAVTTISDLSPDLVTQTQAELTQLMQESYPEVSLVRGAVHDLLAYFGAVFGAWNQQELQSYLNARSLAVIQADPALADPALVADVVSNYGVTPNAGAVATGEVVLVVSTSNPQIIPAGFTFAASGLLFTTPNAFSAALVGTPLVTESVQPITPLGDGTFAFTILVQCTTTGAGGNIAQNTQMTPAATPSNFIRAYAASDFDGGQDTETNAQLLVRLQDGVAAKTLSSAANIRALVLAQPAFANTLDYSAIGFGCPEMTRDQHTIFPGSFGGRVDLYSRTRARPLATTLTKTATLVNITAAGTVWQLTIGRDEAPGFYEVTQILRPADPTDQAGFEVTLDQRHMDLAAGASLVPDLVFTVEGVYSRYQTAVIQFLDTLTPPGPLTLGDQAEYTVNVTGMPLLDQLQDFLGGAQVRYRAGDLLVRGAVPCFLSVNFTINQSRGSLSPDTAAIANALAAAVNGMGFVGQLHASDIAAVTYQFLSGRQAIGPIDMQGRIRRPSGAPHWLRDRTVLQVPNDPGNYVTPSTVVFILDPNDIGITVATEGYPDEV